VGTAYYDNLQFALFDSSVDNKTIMMGANGTLSGAGGGAVTITGLGYTGSMDADKTSSAITSVDLAAQINTNTTTINGGKITTGSITAESGVIANLAVNTLQIAGNAVTVPAVANGGSVAGNGDWILLVEAWIFISQSGMIYAHSSSSQAYGYGTVVWNMKLEISDVWSPTIGGYSVESSPTCAVAGSFAAGWHYSRLWWFGQDSRITITGSMLFMQGAMK